MRATSLPALLLLLPLAALAGCGGGEEKFNVKMTGVELRNLRNKDLGLELKFDRTVRSFAKEDGVDLAAKIYGKDGAAPSEVNVKGIDGMTLGDILVVAGAGTHDPAAFYKVEATLSRKGRVFASGLWLVEDGIGRKVDRATFDAAAPPAPATAPAEGEPPAEGQ